MANCMHSQKRIIIFLFVSFKLQTRTMCDFIHMWWRAEFEHKHHSRLRHRIRSWLVPKLVFFYRQSRTLCEAVQAMWLPAVPTCCCMPLRLVVARRVTRLCCIRALLERHSDGSACPLWPTPTKRHVGIETHRGPLGRAPVQNYSGLSAEAQTANIFLRKSVYMHISGFVSVD